MLLFRRLRGFLANGRLAFVACLVGSAALIARQQLDHLLAHSAEVGTKLREYLRSDALPFADQPEQNVLRSDMGVSELHHFTNRQLKHLLGARREGNVAGRRAPAPSDDFLNLSADAL